MGTLEAIVLGIIQGATEFLPVSSSGHLVLAPELLDLTPAPLSFDVLLHLATSLAVAVYFIREIRNMVLAFVSPDLLPEGEVKPWRRLALWVILGTIPAGLAGVLLEDTFASLFQSTLVVGLALLMTGFLLLGAEWAGDRVQEARRMGSLGVVDVLLIGVMQALAIIPGISRSGATIAGGMFLGLGRTQAARFSFLLSIPVILGAGLVSAGDLAQGFSEGTGVYVAGTLAAFFSGLLAVHFLLRLVRTRSLRPFAFYVFILGGFVTLVSLL